MGYSDFLDLKRLMYTGGWSFKESKEELRLEAERIVDKFNLKWDGDQIKCGGFAPSGAVVGFIDYWNMQKKSFEWLDRSSYWDDEAGPGFEPNCFICGETNYSHFNNPWSFYIWWAFGDYLCDECCWIDPDTGKVVEDDEDPIPQFETYEEFQAWIDKFTEDEARDRQALGHVIPTSHHEKFHSRYRRPDYEPPIMRED